MDSHQADRTDEQLVGEATAGSVRSFEHLVNRYAPTLYAIAYVRLQNREAAEDVVQEAFLRGFLHLGRLAAGGQFAAWMGRITRNLACDWRRQERRLGEILSAYSEQAATTAVPVASNEEGLPKMEADEQRRAIQKVIHQLPPDQGEIVLLHFGEGLGTAEIARRLDVHPTTVRRQLKRARAAMREKLTAVMEESLAAIRPPARVAVRTMALVGVAAGLTVEAKAAVVAAAGGSAWLSAVSQPTCTAAGVHGRVVPLLKSLLTAATTGGKTMMLIKGIGVIALVFAALLVGTRWLHGTGQAVAPVQAVHEASPMPTQAVEPVTEDKPVEMAAVETAQHAGPATQVAIEPSAGAGNVETPAPKVAVAENDAATGSQADPAPATPAEPATAPNTVEPPPVVEVQPVAARLDRARTVQFPADRSLGTLMIRPRVPSDSDHPLYAKWQDFVDQPHYLEWQDYGEATGLVTLPANTELNLRITGQGARDLSPLAQLAPGTLRSLDLTNIKLDPAQWAHIGRLSGLEVLVLAVSNVQDEDLAQLRSLTSLRVLQLPSCASITDEGLKHLEAFISLEELNLHDCRQITDAGLAHLARITRLKNLALGRTKVRGPGLKHLANMKSLEGLSLAEVKLSDDSLAALRGLTTLHYLDLSNTGIGDEGLAHLAGLTSLESLVLRGTKVTDRGLALLKDLTGLRTLLLINTAAGDAGMGYLPELKSLEWLEPPSQITDASIEQFNRLTGLHRLSLQGTKISGESLASLRPMSSLCLQLPDGMTDRDLAGIGRIENLDGLWIQGSPAITAAGLAQLKGLKSLKDVLIAGLSTSAESYAVLQEWPALEQLRVYPQSMARAADGSSWLKYVEGLPALETLVLNLGWGGRVLDEDIRHLSSLPSLKNLEILDHEFTDAGVAALKQCPVLEEVRAFGTKITEAGAAQLPSVTFQLDEVTIPASVAAGSPESRWQRYVRRFIADYSLDAAQQQAAHSVLREMCDEATRYRQAHNREFADLEAQLTRKVAATPAVPPDAREERARIDSLRQQRERLETPVQVSLFNRLKERLERLPRQDQRRAGQ